MPLADNRVLASQLDMIPYVTVKPVEPWKSLDRLVDIVALESITTTVRVTNEEKLAGTAKKRSIVKINRQY